MTFPMRRFAALAAFAALGACSTETVNAPQATQDLERFGSVANYSTTEGLPQAGKVTVCSWYLPGTFTASASGAGLQTASFSLGAVDLGASCEVVWEAPAGYAGGTTVTVTETAAGGTQPMRINVFGGATGTDGDREYLKPINSATVTMTPGLGIAIWFKNESYTPPPPPSGNGCTPGYWKQSQHFDSYPAGVLPTTLFSAAGFTTSGLASPFAGRNFLWVISNGGGGVAALGRHAGAAYLNSLSTLVDYPYTSSQVVSAFNAAIATGDLKKIETAKDELAAMNEAQCPLN